VTSNPKVIRLFIASPGGVEEERNLVEAVVDELAGTLPVNWELSRVLRWENLVGEFGRPQAQINPMVEVCDVFVGILADRLGSPTGVKESGFVEEYELARERRLAAGDGKPKIFIFSKEVSLVGTDAAELMRVKEFLDGLVERREVIVNRFSSPGELEKALRQALVKFILEQIEAAPPSAETLVGGAGADIRLASPSGSPPVPKPEGPLEAEAPAPAEMGEEREPEPTAEVRDWSAALTEAPLRDVGELDAAEEAAEKAEREPEEAAAIYERISGKLAAAEYDALADDYAQRAAKLYEEAGRPQPAIALLEGVAKRQLRRGSGLAEPTARRLMEMQGPEDEWRGRALLARLIWPEDFESALDWLRAALERLEESGKKDGDEWLEVTAAAVELLVLDRGYAEAIEAAEAARELPLAGGERLQIELDVAEAVEMAEGSEAGEKVWRGLLEFVSSLGEEECEEAARVWQRRGVALAVREDVEGARDAFRRAVVEWERRPGSGDQVREAYFSAQISAGLNARFSDEGERLRPIAAYLRGERETPASRADSLQDSGMGSRLRGKAFDALRNYWLSFAEHRRAGNLRGVSYLAELLGELYVHVEEPEEAVDAFVHAGREAEAAKAAGSRPGDRVLDALDLGPARWRRAASFAAIAAVGRSLSVEGVEQLAGQVLDEAEQEFGGIVSPQPAMRAQEALAAIVFEVPAPLRERTLARLRELARGDFVGTARPAAEALQLLTNSSVSDETETLAKAFLADSSISGISPIWIGGRLEENPKIKKEVLKAAAGGHRDALEASAVGGVIGEKQGLVELCEQQVHQSLEQGARSEDSEGSGVVVGGNFELTALLAHFVDPPLAEEFAQKLVELADDVQLPLLTRLSAINGLFNIASVLSPESRMKLADRLDRLVEGEIEVSPWDSDDPHPFSRFQIQMGKAEDLQAASLAAWARLREGDLAGEEEEGDLGPLIRACVGASSAVAAAAYEAIARINAAKFPAFGVAGLAHPDARVRAAATRAWLSRTKILPAESVLSDLLIDGSLSVRLALVWNASELPKPERERLLHQLESDQDAYVRALARHELKQVVSV
jgi:tetratricopeptide (TPR) repeat protein